MAVHVLLEFDNDEDAKAYAIALQTYRSKYRLRGIWKKATLFCDNSDGHRGKKTESGYTRGKKYGWWVCGTCGKPSKAWAGGHRWFGALGTNLLPLALLSEEDAAEEYRPVGWRSGQQWSFLLPENVCDWDWKANVVGTPRVQWCYDHNRPLSICQEETST
jgi:hypothetical protein